MESAAIVPDDQLACLPVMFVDELRAYDEFVELIDERSPLVVGHPDDSFSVIAEIDAPPLRVGMDADDGVLDWRHLIQLVFG